MKNNITAHVIDEMKLGNFTGELISWTYVGVPQLGYFDNKIKRRMPT